MAILRVFLVLRTYSSRRHVTLPGRKIVNALLPSQTASDRPDIVTRVFHGKLKALFADAFIVRRESLERSRSTRFISATGNDVNRPHQIVVRQDAARSQRTRLASRRRANRFRWNNEDRAWVLRKVDNRTIGRIYFGSSEGAERYHLRLLLLKMPSLTSFADPRTFHWFQFRAVREACVEQGLLRNDAKADRCLTEAAVFRTGHGLRHLFAMLFTADDGVTNTTQL